MDKQKGILAMAKLQPDFSHRLANNGEITADESLEVVLLDSISLSTERAKNLLAALNIYMEAETFYPSFCAVKNELEDINCLIASYWNAVNDKMFTNTSTNEYTDSTASNKQASDSIL